VSLNRFLGENLFTAHFRNDEDNDGPAKASASKEIDQGVTNGGQQMGQYY
jgi:hypothetical protein